MSFLGRSLEEKVEEGSGGEGEMGKQRSRKKIYAGVVAFCLPPALASRGEGAASEEYQVWKKQVIFSVSLTPPPPLLPPFPFFLPRASITYAHVYTWDMLLCKLTYLLFAQQVVNMVGYAMGEIAKPALKEEEKGEEEGGGRTLTRWYPNDSDCYEVVTAWVHPRY